jgi:hypothetical protein
MRRIASFKVLSTILALGLVIQPIAATQAQQARASQITDVELKSDNTFQGKPVDARGQIQSNAQVTVQNVQTGQTVRTTTAADGTFGIQNLQPGVYDITVGSMTSTVRIWPFQAAPAGSVQQVAYYDGDVGTTTDDDDDRGGWIPGNNGGGGSNWLVGGAILGVTAGIIIAVTAS